MKKLKKSEIMIRSCGPVTHEDNYPAQLTLRDGRLVEIKTGKTPVFTDAKEWEGKALTLCERSEIQKLHRLARLGCELCNAMKMMLNT